MSKLVVLLTCLLFNTLSVAEVLRTASQNSYPKYYQTNSGMRGICIDILKSLEETTPDLRFEGHNKFLPFPRLQHYLEKGSIDVFCGLRRTAKREDKYVFLDTPLYHLNYVFAARKNDTINLNALDQINTLEDNTVLTLNGSAADNFLVNRGIQTFDVARSSDKLIELLALGRVRLTFYHDFGLLGAIKRGNYEKQIHILDKSYLEYFHSMAFSKRVPEATIRKVALALQKLSKQGKLKEIAKSYGLKN